MRQIYQFVIFALTIVIVGIAILYDNQVIKSNKDSIQAPISHSVSDGYSTIVIDSCEYIEAFNRLAHKGNCRFCANRRREELKMIDELIKEK